MLPDIHLKHKCNDVNKLVKILVWFSAKLIGGWQIIWIDEMKIHLNKLMQACKKQQQLELPQY